MEQEFRYRLRGEVDLAVAPSVVDDLRAIVLATDRDILIDCEELTFIDSSGVNALLEVHKILQPLGRRLRVVNLHDNPAKVFDILGLTDLLCADGSLAE